MKLARWYRPALIVGLAAAWLAGITIASERSASGMATAAQHFLDALTPEQRQQAAFPFDSDERMRWHYIPNEQFQRKGLAVKAMTEPQRALAHALLKAGLSQRGYLTATHIMDLENVLRAMENGQFARDPQGYFFSVFGTPSAKGMWGWRVNGHHLALDFTVADGSAVDSTPTFFGTNPAEVREGPEKGLRVLGPQEDAGRALLMALDPSQRTTATFANVAPNDIVTKTAAKVEPLVPAGLEASAMTPAQRELLMRVIETYSSQMVEDLAAERMAKIRAAGVEKIAFAWAGEAEPGKKHYYRVQGPTFLIEYDNTQNNANHVHSVWRDFNGDFGRDLLREHVNGVQP